MSLTAIANHPTLDIAPKNLDVLRGRLPGEDDESDALTYALVAEADAATSIGTLEIQPSGAYEYTPPDWNPDNTVARFQYRVSQVDDPSKSALGTFEVRLILGQDILRAGELPAGSAFGASVDFDSVSGTLIIGAPPQHAFIAQRAADGDWELVQTLELPDGVRAMGGSVAIHGEWALVGDYFEGNVAPGEPGQAILYRRNGQRFERVETLTAGVPTDAFGWRVALDDTRAIVAAKDDGEATGAVYIYERVPGGLRPPRKLMLDPARPYDLFGTEVALEGDTLVVSAPLADDATRGDAGAVKENAGAAFVYSLSNLEQAPRAFYGLEPDQRLDAIAYSRDTLVIGASRAYSAMGMVNIFEHDGANWQSPFSLPHNSQIQDGTVRAGSAFGTEVATDGETTVISTRHHVENLDLGAGFVYQRKPGAGWQLWDRITTGRRDVLGFSIAVNGRQLALGAPDDKPSGAVYLYQIPPTR